MNSLSISGKNWLLKNFNQEDISFIKENCLLVELTANLVSIRQGA
jgi:hypothetical protein